MDWTQAVDAYCERDGAGLWAEPLNAMTNLAFLLAAWVMWRRVQGADLPLARALVVVLALIGLGSLAFHTVAQVWAGLADVAPILAFAVLYIFAATRDFLSFWPWKAAMITGLAVAGMAASVPLFAPVPLFGASAGYLPLVVLFVLYAAVLRQRAPALARGLSWAAVLLAVSLTLRSLDMVVCPVLPVGTHLWWHLINAVLLAWLIELYRRHMLARP